MALHRAIALFIWSFSLLLGAGLAFSQETETPASQATEIYVWGQQPASAATEKTIRQKDFELQPTTTPADILRLVPGLFIAQHQGGGKAEQYFLRGFDADHGTDVAIFVDGIPVNMPSHAHGQGYADLHWLIPEVVDHVEVYKGPYFVQFGDFDTAGAVNIITKRRAPDTTFSIMGGSYSIQRYLSVLSPPEGRNRRHSSYAFPGYPGVGAGKGARQLSDFRRNTFQSAG